MDYVELYEAEGGWRWRRITADDTVVSTDSAVYPEYFKAMRAAADATGGNLRVCAEDPDRYWVL